MKELEALLATKMNARNILNIDITHLRASLEMLKVDERNRILNTN